MKNFIVLLALAITCLSSCVSEKEKAQSAKAQTFVGGLNESTGQKWEVIKYGSDQPGYMVFRNNTTGVYYAMNVGKWDGVSTYDQFKSNALEGDILSPLLSKSESIKSTDFDGKVTYEENIYYVYGGLRFSNTSTATRDLETVGAMREQVTQTYLTHHLQSEYSLSSDRAAELAKLSTRYKRLENSRALTVAEKNVFAMSALGVNMSQVERAMKDKANGQQDSYEDMLETAARVNRTTPEQVGRFFDEMGGVL